MQVSFLCSPSSCLPPMHSCMVKPFNIIIANALHNAVKKVSGKGMACCQRWVETLTTECLYGTLDHGN